MHKVLGTRRSPLARKQTGLVADLLRELCDGLSCETVPILTSGDEGQYVAGPLPPAGIKGLFTAELEDALRGRRIDLAVHSLKDLPAFCDPEFLIAPVMGREHPFDVLINRDRVPLAMMKSGSRVGTSSIRRVAQLRKLRPDFEFVEIRGNIDTRLRKLDEGDVDAVILAEAGLQRVGLGHRVVVRFTAEEMVPSPGQGVLAVQYRADDIEAKMLASFLVDVATTRAVEAERAFVHELGATCQTPLGVYATVSSGTVRLLVRCCSRDGDTVLDLEGSAPESDSYALGRELAASAVAKGARALLGL